MDTLTDNSHYRIADPHSPRFLKKRFDILNSTNRAFYSGMKKQCPDLVKYHNSDIAKCIEIFNKRIAQEVTSNRNGVRLSDGLGIIVAGACKVSRETSRNNIDHAASALLNTPVMHQNLHSNGYVFKIKYSNDLDKHMFDNHNMWCFEPDRPFSRKMSAIFKTENGWKNYIVFTTRQHIAHLFRKQKIPKESVISFENKKKRLEEYDEFAIN